MSYPGCAGAPPELPQEQRHRGPTPRPDQRRAHRAHQTRQSGLRGFRGAANLAGLRHQERKSWRKRMEGQRSIKERQGEERGWQPSSCFQATGPWRPVDSYAGLVLTKGGQGVSFCGRERVREEGGSARRPRVDGGRKGARVHPPLQTLGRAVNPICASIPAHPNKVKYRH